MSSGQLNGQEAARPASTRAFATVLQHRLDGSTAPGDAFGTTFWWPLAVAVLALVPAVLLPASRTDAAPEGADR